MISGPPRLRTWAGFLRFGERLIVGILLVLLVALLICAGVCLIIWGIVAVLSMFVPSPPMNVIRVVLWVVGGITCIIVLIGALTGSPVVPLMFAPSLLVP